MKRFTILVSDEDAEQLNYWAMRDRLKICASEVRAEGPTVTLEAFFADFETGQERDRKG